MATNDSLQEQDYQPEEESNSNLSVKEEQHQDEKKEEIATTNGGGDEDAVGAEEDEDLEEGELKDDDDDDDEDDDANGENTSSQLPSNHQQLPQQQLQPQQQQHQQQQQQHQIHHQYHNNNNNNNNNNNSNNSNNNTSNTAQHVSGSTPMYYPLHRGNERPSNAGPMYKVNIRCRFYSKTQNKCTWGENCRFEHRDDSPGPEFDNRPMPGLGPGSSRGPPPPMGAAERQYPPYAGRHQPYSPPPPPSQVYPYEPYGHHHHSTTPPLPHTQSMSHWRAQHGGPAYPAPSSRGPPPPMGAAERAGQYPAHASQYPPHSGQYPPYAGRHQPYPPPPPPPSQVYPYEPYGHHHHHSTTPPLSHTQPMSHWRAQHSSPAYPAPSWPAHRARGGPIGPHASHYKSMSSSQRIVPPDTRRSRSNKRGHDEDESSWSDSGSEDSILGQANYSNKYHASKVSKQQTTDNNPTSDEPIEQGSGTPPGEPLPEDRERQEMLLNKLKEIEDLMAKKKGEQEDPM